MNLKKQKKDQQDKDFLCFYDYYITYGLGRGGKSKK